MSGWTMKEIRDKTRQMLDDSRSGMNRKKLMIAIQLGQSSFSRFMSAPENKIPSIEGDALLRLLGEVEQWMRSPIDGTNDATKGASWVGYEAALVGQLAIVRSDVSVEEKQAAAQDFLSFYAKIGEGFRSITTIEQED